MKNDVRFKITEFLVHCVFLTYVLYGRFHLKISFLCFLDFFWLHLSLFLISFLIVFAQQISLVCRRLFNFSHAHEERPRGRERGRRTDIYGKWDLSGEALTVNCTLQYIRETRSTLGSKTGLSRNEHCDCDRGWDWDRDSDWDRSWGLSRPQLKLKSKSTSAPAPPAPQSGDWAERERMLAAAGNVCVGNSTGIYLSVCVGTLPLSGSHAHKSHCVCVVLTRSCSHSLRMAVAFAHVQSCKSKAKQTDIHKQKGQTEQQLIKHVTHERVLINSKKEWERKRTRNVN